MALRTLFALDPSLLPALQLDAGVQHGSVPWAPLPSWQSANCATASIRHLRQVKTLITSACLKHFELLKIDNWIEKCLTAVHMNPFSMKERVRRLGSTDSYPTADAKCV